MTRINTTLSTAPLTRKQLSKLIAKYNKSVEDTSYYGLPDREMYIRLLATAKRYLLLNGGKSRG